MMPLPKVVQDEIKTSATTDSTTILKNDVAHIDLIANSDARPSRKTVDATLTKLEVSKRRLDLYHDVHDGSEKQMLLALKKYATDEPLTKKLHTITDDIEVEEEAPVVLTRHSDIWGKVPPKEPKQLAKCTICDRDVSALRFAPHLDKCMNLGSVRVAAANNTAVSSVRGTAK